MADTSLFGRLTRLFSNDVVIRNIGGDELKIADTNSIQQTGRYETNSLVDSEKMSNMIILIRKKCFWQP